MISIKGLMKHFPNERAITYKDMDFEDGKSYMLLGASGCGKSTLLNMIAGILSADEGEILIGGEDMMKKSIYSRLVECYLYFKRYQDAYNCQKKVCMYANMEDPFEESDEERRALEKLKAIRKLMEE